MVALSTILCFFAAALFWTCNALEIVIGVTKSGMWQNADQNAYLQLLPDDLVSEWVNRESLSRVEFASHITSGIFWVVFIIPVIEMAWILSRGGTESMGLNTAIMIFVLAGNLTKWFTTVFWNGMHLSLLMMARNFNLDDWLSSLQDAQYQLDGEDGMGWRVLEVLFLAAKGLVWIVNAAEWFCLAGVFILSFFSVLKWRKHDESTFGAKWNALGLFIGLVSAVDFIAEIIGVEGYKIAWIFVVLYSSLTKLILIPLWIIILGFQLPLATSKAFDSGVGEVEMAEEPQDGQDQRPAPFTIDEDDDVGEGEGDDPNGPTSPPPEAFSSTNPTATS